MRAPTTSHIFTYIIWPWVKTLLPLLHIKKVFKIDYLRALGGKLIKPQVEGPTAISSPPRLSLFPSILLLLLSDGRCSLACSRGSWPLGARLCGRGRGSSVGGLTSGLTSGAHGAKAEERFSWQVQMFFLFFKKFLEVSFCFVLFLGGE